MFKRIFNSIGLKTLFGVVIIGGIFTTLFSFLSITQDYNKDIQLIHSRLDQIKQSYVDSITNSVWNLDTVQIKIALEGLGHIDDIEYVAIKDSKNIMYENGEAVTKGRIIRVYPLVFNYEGVREYIGDLYIEATTEHVKKRMKNKAAFAIFVKVVEVTCFAIFIVIFIKLILTRHISKITDFFITEDIYDGHKHLELNRDSEFLRGDKDELDILVDSINLMKSNLNREWKQRHNFQKELELLNLNLEKKVVDKTTMLLESNKLAALGEMAASVAHEINSPLSYVFGVGKRLIRLQKSGRVNETEFLELLESQISTLRRVFVITSGLNALSSASGDVSYVTLAFDEYIKEKMKTIEEIFRSSGVNITYSSNSCDKNIEIEKNKLFQLLFNFVTCRVKKLTVEEKSWLKVEFTINKNEIIIKIFDSIGIISEVELNCLNDPFKAKKGIDKGSNLELNSIKPLCEKLNARAFYNSTRANFVVQFTMEVIKKDED